MKLPKKVLHVLSGPTGGATLSALSLMRGLKKHGVASAVVCHDFGSDVGRREILEVTDGEAIFLRLYWWNKKIRSPAWKRPIQEGLQIARTGWGLESAAKVARVAARWDARLVHTQTIMPVEGSIAARLLGLPHVWHVREMIGPTQPFRLPVEGPQLGEYLVRRASKLVANSHATGDQIRAWLPPGLLEVVPNGIDLSNFQKSPPRAPGSKVVVAMVGSLSSRWKKHALFVEAAARLPRDLPVDLRIYGDLPGEADPYLAELRAQIARHGLDDRLRLMGHVASPVELIAEIDVLAQVSDRESFGRVVVEAMAAQVPVVAARGAAAKELVEHDVTGLHARPDDADDVAQAIERMVRDPALRERMGAAARLRAERLYSMEACVEGMCRVYRGAMTRPLGAWTAINSSVRP